MPQSDLHDPILRRPSAAVRWSTFLGKGVLLFIFILLGIWTWNNTPLSHWMREANARTAQSADTATAARDQAKLAADEQHAQIDANRALHQKLLDEAADTIRSLDELGELHRQWTTRISQLLQGTDGAQLASDPELVASFVQLTTTRTPPEINTQALRSRVESIRHVSEQRLQQEDFTAAPAQPTVDEIASAARTAVQNLDAYRQANLEVEALVQEAKTANLPPASTTLADAIRALDAKAKQQEIAAYTAAAEDAMDKMKDKIIAEAAASAMRREEERAKFIADTHAQLEGHEKQLHDLELAQQRRDQEAESTRVAQEGAKKEALARKEQEERDREKAQIEADAKKQTLVARCQSSEVTNKLRYFTAPGLWQPDGKDRGTDPMPMSYSAIKAAGCLEDSKASLTKLYVIGYDPRDASRPRLARANPNNPRELEGLLTEARDIQKLLIELGPTLVELKMLAP